MLSRIFSLAGGQFIAVLLSLVLLQQTTVVAAAATKEEQKRIDSVLREVQTSINGGHLDAAGKQLAELNTESDKATKLKTTLADRKAKADQLTAEADGVKDKNPSKARSLYMKAKALNLDTPNIDRKIELTKMAQKVETGRAKTGKRFLWLYIVGATALCAIVIGKEVQSMNKH